jgi:iron complex transport system ATP-binding protein
MSVWLSFSDVKVGYEQAVLHVPDMQFTAPGWISLYGPNGSGKSTLLYTICGHVLPQRGQVLLQGISVHHISAAERAARMAFADTSRPALPGFTVREVIGMHVHTAARGEELIHDIATRLHLTTFLDRIFSALSDGEKQMVLIARAIHQLLSSPETEGQVLVLDEPSSFLDYRNKLRLYAFLQLLSRKVLVIMAGHDFETSLSYADQCLIVEDQQLLLYTGEALSVATVAEKLR